MSLSGEGQRLLPISGPGRYFRAGAEAQGARLVSDIRPKLWDTAPQFLPSHLSALDPGEGTCLVDLWLRLHAFSAGGPSFHPWLGNYPMCCLVWFKKKKKKLQKNK